MAELFQSFKTGLKPVKMVEKKMSLVHTMFPSQNKKNFLNNILIMQSLNWRIYVLF